AQPAQPLPALTWGDSDTAQLGENVIAIGFALGLKGEPTVSSGIISALHRDVAVRWPYLQHTAPINHGNSGGPLLDQMGRVIGINTLLDENAQSVYFAIPAAPAKQKAADFIGAMPKDSTMRIVMLASLSGRPPPRHYGGWGLVVHYL